MAALSSCLILPQLSWGEISKKLQFDDRFFLHEYGLFLLIYHVNYFLVYVLYDLVCLKRVNIANILQGGTDVDAG